MTLSENCVSSSIIFQEIGTTLSSENSWKTRLACLEFLQALVFNNLMLFSVRQKEIGEKVDGDKLRTRVIQTVMDCLHDTQIEVRVKAAQVSVVMNSEIGSNNE